jgi:hypothetical protein
MKRKFDEITINDFVSIKKLKMMMDKKRKRDDEDDSCAMQEKIKRMKLNTTFSRRDILLYL